MTDAMGEVRTIFHPVHPPMLHEVGHCWGVNPYLDWQARFIKILAFQTAKVAGTSELI
jgi:hypothetical protein